MIQAPSAYAQLGDLFYLSDSQTITDFYFYYKSVAIYICTVWAGLCFGYRAVTGTLWVRKSRLYLPLIIYFALVFLSYFFSEYRNIAWHGTDGLYSGAAVLLCCGFVFFYVINSITNEKCIKWFLWPLTVCIAVISVLGITQWAGSDFFRSTLGQKLLVPNSETISGEMTWSIIDNLAGQGKTALEFVFDTAVYQTVGNPNYVALYTPLVLPLFALLFIRERNVTSHRIIWVIMFGLILFNLFASQSTGGIVGIICALIAAILLSLKSIRSNVKSIGVLAVVVIACCLLNFQTFEINHTNNSNETEQNNQPSSAKRLIEQIHTESNRVVFIIDGEEFEMTDDPATLTSLPEFIIASLEIHPDGQSIINIQIEGESRVWQFIRTSEGYRFINDIGKLVVLRDVPRVGNDEFIHLGTGRVYIWSRTLPLLKNAIFLGYGPDTFMLYFPQDDYVGRYNGDWDLRAVIDKPHNLYLNIAFGSGILSLVAFLTIIILYFYQSIRLYRNHPKNADLIDTFGRGIFIGICGFLAAGMFYDGVTSVMPLFWGLFGLGIACNILSSATKQKNN